MSLGLIGVGNLGLELGLVLKKSFRIVAYDVDPSRLQHFQAARSVSEVAREENTIISVVPNDQVLRSVVDELGDFRGLHISCSTISPHTSRELFEVHRARGARYVAAPVFARPENMRAGQASFVVSGEGLEDASDILKKAGAVYSFGKEDPGAANVVKLTGNYMIGASINVLGEGLAFAEANGVDRVETMNMLRSTIFDCAIFNGYGDRIARRDHEGSGGLFKASHGLKDANLVLDTAHLAGQPMAVGNIMRDRLIRANSTPEHRDLDWSAVALQPSIDGGRNKN